MWYDAGFGLSRVPEELREWWLRAERSEVLSHIRGFLRIVYAGGPGAEPPAARDSNDFNGILMNFIIVPRM